MCLSYRHQRRLPLWTVSQRCLPGHVSAVPPAPKSLATLIDQQFTTHPVCVQGLLCGVLQVIVQKLSETDATKPGVLQYGDAIMEVSRRGVLLAKPV